MVTFFGLGMNESISSGGHGKIKQPIFNEKMMVN
jgi:hypothetical protein